MLRKRRTEKMGDGRALDAAIDQMPFRFAQCEHICQSARCFNVAFALGSITALRSKSKVSVVVILVDRRDRAGSINDGDTTHNATPNEPRIPPLTADSELRHFKSHRSRKNEVVHSAV